MTPSKKGKVTVIRIEKVKKTNIDDSQVAHKAGGQHTGLVINKQAAGSKTWQLQFLQKQKDNKRQHFFYAFALHSSVVNCT